MRIITYSRFFEKKIGKSYKLQSCFLKQEIEHDEIFEDNWKEKKWMVTLF